MAVDGNRDFPPSGQNDCVEASRYGEIPIRIVIYAFLTDDPVANEILTPDFLV